MNDTPRTDEFYDKRFSHHCTWEEKHKDACDFARQLERELEKVKLASIGLEAYCSGLQSDNAELLERLEDRVQSHLDASARDVQTIQQQTVAIAQLERENAEMKVTLHLVYESQQRMLALSDKFLEQKLK